MNFLSYRARSIEWAVLASVSLLLALVAATPAQADFSDYAIGSVSASLSTSQAGAHPDFTTSISFKQNPSSNPDHSGALEPYARTRDIILDLPPGLSGDPQAVPECTAQEFSTALIDGTGCPNASQVGIATFKLYDLTCADPNVSRVEPVYNLDPPGDGRNVARLGFWVATVPSVVDVSLRPDRDYALTASAQSIYSALPLISATVTLWGVPADPSHDTQRMTPPEAAFSCAKTSPPRPPGISRTAFMTNPTSCGSPVDVGFAADSYQNPGVFETASAPLPPFTGCDRLDFTPQIDLQPTTHEAATSTGIDADLRIPQDAITDPAALAEAHLRDAVVTLPQGMALNPSSADGLTGCTEAQIGLLDQGPPASFDSSTPTCPDSSKVGTARITTPLLPNPIPGSLYLADPKDNPFHTLVAGYLVAQGNGVLLKIPARFDLDPNTGQITATFDNNPQQPFSELQLHFNGGSRGVLVTPPSCGTFQIQAQLTPWSGTPPVDSTNSFTIDQGCSTGGFSPQMTAGVTNPVAGSSSSFTLQLTRNDGEQNISSLTTVLPPGLVAKLAGVPLCPDARAAIGDCPADSQVGSTIVGTGAGPEPLYIPQAGEDPTAVYLAGPYKSAPYSLIIKVPAQAGPFDLGTVAVRAGIYIDPTTAQVTVVSDPLPQIMQGIPLPYRDIRVMINRAGFIQAPTSCNPTSVSATVTGAPVGGSIRLNSAGIGFAASAGSAAQLTSRFQVGDCANLNFSPRLRMRLSGKGKTHSGNHPTLTATLTQRSGQANIHTARVALPLSLALDPKNSQHVCAFATAQALHGGAVGCPASTIVGTATAVTPLLSRPLSGPVYLVQGIRFSRGQAIHTLPSLLIPLRGQIALDLRAQSAVSGGKLVTTFSTIPDAPVSKFTLKINGGRKGILVITGRGKTICGKKQVSNATLGAQSGKRDSMSVTMSKPCRPAARHRQRKPKKNAKANKHAVASPVTDRRR